MLDRLLADIVFSVHLGFVVFALCGGLLLLRDQRWAWLHVPAVLWATAVEIAGWVCPLTPLESWLRVRSGAAGYEVGFIADSLEPVLYPTGLTREHQIALGAALLVANLALYYGVLRHRGWRMPRE